MKYALNESKIRIDYVGHALSTVAQYIDDRQADPSAHFALIPLEPDQEPVDTTPAVLPETGGSDAGDEPGEGEGGD